jgi:hypothetical protein
MKIKKSNIDIVKGYLAGERPFIQVGYTPPAPTRKEGEQWVDTQGVCWEQKTGYKVRVNPQANLIREAARQKCACGQEIQYGTHLDGKFFVKTGRCFDCIIKEETELRILGVWPTYEKYKLMSNYLGFLEDMKQKIEESIKYFETESDTLKVLCNAEGFIEKFTGLNTPELLKSAKTDLREVSKTIVTVTKNKAKAKKAYETELAKVKKTLTPKKQKPPVPDNT